MGACIEGAKENKLFDLSGNKTHKASDSVRLLSGTQRLKIDCYGTVKIHLKPPMEEKSMTLLNAAYVSDFLSNLVA